MVNENEDVPNWILEYSSVLSQKMQKKFYSFGMECVDWRNLILLDDVSPAKTLAL